MVENLSAETPANLTVLDTAAIQNISGIDLDDRLRQVPGFSLFRRASSVVANPTTQGVSLRGLGSSGASRTLVLWDGVPVNDPFGGWVYWTRFIPEEIGEVEISRGAATSAFGNLAMGGAIGLFSRAPERLRLLSVFRIGNVNTRDATLGFSQQWWKLAISGAARAFSTAGYFVVPEPLRGPVDTPAAVRFITGDVRLDAHSYAGDLFFKLDVLAEDRKNGTVLTHNSTGLGSASAHYEKEFGADAFSLLVYHTREQFHSAFSAVSAGRASERLTYLQTVPSQGSGGAAYWQHHAARWNLMAGADAARQSGTSTDRLSPSGLRIGGGSQFQHGVFAQADGAFGPLHLYAGLRHSFTGTGGTFVAPSAGAVLGSKRLRVRAATYRAFRAPTLNELYREFRVGNTDTLANPELRPETLFGAEAGADWTGERSAFRFTAFRNSLDALISNVTISSGPNSILRQRRNAARALSRGVEAGAERRFRYFRATASYLFVDSRYSTGMRVAQVPKHQGSAQLVYDRRGTFASLEVRSYSYQFDDDLNQFTLPGFSTAQLLVRRRVAASLSVEAALDNALDRRFYTAFTPTPVTGQPRLWRIGLIWDGRL